MEQGATPFRSVLYLPGSRHRVLEKARSLPADAVILDLEDAVTPSEKPLARDLVGQAVTAGGFGHRRVLARINGLETDWGRDDLAAMCGAGPDAILVPKVESAGMIAEVAAILSENGAPDRTRIWAMMETPRGVLNAAEIARSHSRLEGFVMGTNDLAKDLGATQTADRLPLMSGLGLCLLAARAEGLVCVDGVHNAFRDDEGLEAVCIQGREMGFDGKTLIHPGQIAIANRVFAPSQEDLELAREQIQAHEEAEARGEGVAVVNGRIVENLHVAIARNLLGRSDAIARLSAGMDAG